MRKVEINVKSLETAISEFNDWTGSARIYLDLSDGVFETSVYTNDVDMVETFSTDNFISVYAKNEPFSKNENIGEKRKDYIIKYSNLILDGYEPIQAQYKLGMI